MAPDPRSRLLVALATLASFVALGLGPVGAQETTTSTSSSTSSSSTTAADSTSSTSSSSSTSTSSTTAPDDVGSTDPDSSTTTSTTEFDPDRELDPDEDPVGDEDTPPPSTVPVSDDTVPPPPGEPVDGEEAERIIRRELRVARAQALESEAEVRAATETVDQLSRRLAGIQRELARLDVAQQLAIERLDFATEVFQERVANAVVRGNAAELDTVFSSQDANEIETRKIFLRSVSEADSAAVVELQAAKRVVDDGILAALDDLARTRRELREARQVLEETLRVNTEHKFQLAVFAAGSEIVIRGFVFPVGEPYQFIDSWGFPRMVGTEYEHGHQGTDIMAPFGTSLYAVERGVVIRVGTDVLGGTKLWVKGQSGTYYYYAHLLEYAEEITEGTFVEAGDVVGFVGDTGNAKGGAPHLHFQVHPGGGEAVNPYGLLKVVSDLSR